MKSKKIFQFDLEGKFIAVFSSITQARKKLKLTYGQISSAIYHQSAVNKKYYFSYKKRFKLEPIIIPVKEKPQKTTEEKTDTNYYLYDFKKQLVAEGQKQIMEYLQMNWDSIKRFLYTKKRIKGFYIITKEKL